MDEHKTMARKGDTDAKYTDVVSGDDGMTMMVLLSGERDTGLEPLFIVFQNRD